MLILTRRVGEALMIGEAPDCIEVAIIEARGNQVRIGIKAPTTIPVHREEIYKRIQLAKEENHDSDFEKTD